MLDVLGEDYIRTARSKGMTESRVITRHALRAALTPVVTLFGLDVGTALGGAIITEVAVRHARTRLDRRSRRSPSRTCPSSWASSILASAFVVVANLIVDILYAVLDPRVRLY